MQSIPVSEQLTESSNSTKETCDQATRFIIVPVTIPVPDYAMLTAKQPVILCSPSPDFGGSAVGRVRYKPA